MQQSKKGKIAVMPSFASSHYWCYPACVCLPVKVITTSKLGVIFEPGGNHIGPPGFSPSGRHEF